MICLHEIVFLFYALRPIRDKWDTVKIRFVLTVMWVIVDQRKERGEKYFHRNSK